MFEVVSIGCDPEVFLQNPEGKIKSAIGLFGGTKQAPKRLRSLGAGFAVQEDNILMEFNIPPAKNPEEFVNYVQKAMDLLSKRALKKGLSFAKGSAYSVDPEELQHPNALVFGCDPDYNAYTGHPNPPPAAADKCLRSAGGHIAFGFQGFEGMSTWERSAYQMVGTRQLDAIIGVASILLDDGVKRKELYGKAGAYRPKPWGLEYRTLSNFWLWDNSITTAMLKDVVVGMPQLHDRYLQDGESNLVRVAINTNDKDFAKWWVRKNPYLFTNLRAINAV